ncbi:MAG: sigma-70 family RNA polymerase sigma factor [Planctomycetales bacterium]|nr:sigma-70 family RNA polymerase sigma factor [Planctomycetales bacterium]
MDTNLKQLATSNSPAKDERSGSVQTLVADCQAGNRDALRRMFEQFSPKIYRLTVRMADEQEAPDLTQQVFLQVFTKIDQFAGKSQFETWLYRIAINTVLQHRRKASRQRLVPLVNDPIGDRPQNPDRIDYQELLDQALHQVDADLRIIFVLREVEELPYRAIASVLDISEGTVASRLNRARRELKDRLEVLGWQP